jgi:molybdenum cofactor biosynthesis protein MoaC
MINVSHKPLTLRYARAEGMLSARPDTLRRVEEKTVPKGDVEATARAAGIDAAKRTSEWITFCHSLPLDWADLRFEVEEDGLTVIAEAETVWKTGVEIEVMTAASNALLNAYDMLKPLDDTLELTGVRVVEKQGGQSQYRESFDPPLQAHVLVISDSTHAGDREDRSGQVIREFLSDHPVETAAYDVLPDERERIQERVQEAADRADCDLVITTGGTGFGPRDVTPEALAPLLDKDAPGVAEQIRDYGRERTPYAMLSRQIAGTMGQTLVLTLPGSSRGARESMQALFPGLLHIFPMLWGGSHQRPVSSSNDAPSDDAS